MAAAGSPFRPRERREQPVPGSRRRAGIWWWLSLPMLLFLTVPLLALLLRSSPATVTHYLRTPAVQQALALSLGTTNVTMVLAVVLGTPAAYLVARRRFPGRRTVEALLDLPVILPPAVAGVALLLAFGRRGLIGGPLGLEITFTPAAVVMAQLFVASPFFVRAAALGFASVEPELLQAAALDGAGAWRRFRHVALPLAWPALLEGAIMAWARALGEFGATIIFAGNLPGRTQTMPLAIYLGFELELDMALTLAVILLGLSFFALVLVRVGLRKW
ncbi:MAG: ABC transporter permease [Anaerolineae bacterium]|nr:ABC transporter permease [Anaerolineae bacterium]